MADPVKYVSFGGAQVPEGTRREIIDRNGQKIYCVWTDDNGGKVTYPQQQTTKPNQMCYYKEVRVHDTYPNKRPDRIYNESISKSSFEHYWNYSSDDFIKTNWGSHRDITNFNMDSRFTYNTTYNEAYVDTTPQIDIYSDEGLIYDTQNVTLSNMKGATVTGSTDEDNITLMNSSNCTVDVSNANNNIFVSDNVRVVNGQGNKVKAGDHDQVTFGTHNYETNTDTTKANHKGEGTYKQ